MHGPPHPRGLVLPADAVHVRDVIDAAKGLPTTTGQLRDGTEVLDEWLQPSGETDGDGAPILVRVTGGTRHWRDTDPETGELLITPHEAAIVETHGTQRARQAVEAALLRGTMRPPDDPRSPVALARLR